jgi:outer membrane protein assembly factor BamB
MARPFLIHSLLLLFGTIPALSNESDWRQWRGPNGNGTATAAAEPPLTWSETENVKWKAYIPGRGLSSPIVVGDLVIVTTASEDGQFVLAYARSDGSIRWKERVHETGLPTEMHRKNSAATPTPTSDGENLYVSFHNSDRIFLTAYTLKGEQLWQRDAGPYTCDYRFGYAPSPTLHGEMLIVASEFLADGFLAAFATKDGRQLWRTERKVKTSYSSPIVASIGGREQILLSGAAKVSAYDPGNGAILWQVDGSPNATCGTMVWSEDTVFASGGFPQQETLAVRVGETPAVLWKNNDKSYEQSLLYHEGHLYALNDGGIALCWDAKTGEEKWKVRLGGPVSASPTLAGGRIYAMNERGITYVYEPNPAQFTKLAENTLGDEGFATPVFVGSEVFLRTARTEGERKEWLYCLAEGE